MENCLNCGKPLERNYCSFCGQRAHTHRFTMQHFVNHDLVHGLFHVDKGIFFTIRELFSRPGHSVREYVLGKRAKHFNYVTLLVLLVALGFFLNEYSHFSMADISGKSNEHLAKLEGLSTKYPKLFTIGLIPLYSITSYLFFRKSKQNFAENIVLNFFRASGELMIGILLTLVSVISTNINLVRGVYIVVVIVTLSYTVWFYYQYFYPFFKNKKLLFFRAVLAVITVTFLFTLLSFVI